MKHFKKEKWEYFVKDLIDENIREEMELHLLHCNGCLNIYLEAVENIQLPKMENTLGEEFTDKVMKKIEKENKKQDKGVSNLLLYYCCAAIITLLFMSSGLFDFLGESILEHKRDTMAFISSNGLKQEYVAKDISKKLINGTGNLINSFMNKK